jgi:ABC-2 type transport system permease protein
VAVAAPPESRAGRDWGIVAGQETRDLWLAGRGLPLTLALSLLLSVMTYLGATNQSLNFLERRETVNLTVQVAVAVGALLAMVLAADAVSGERERGTLESLLLAPVSRGGLVAGKLLGALSFWAVTVAIAVPYLWFLARGVGAFGDAIGAAAIAGTLVAVAFTAFGVVVSAVARSNRLSLSVSLFALLALYVPTQLPAGAKQGWAGELLQRVNPVTAAEHWIGKVVINQHPFTQDAAWLLSPAIAAAGLTAVALVVVPRFLSLRGGTLG